MIRAPKSNKQGLYPSYRLWVVLILVSLAFISLLPVPALLNLFHDDSFFYMVIARHHAAGLGYSFDGLNQTNGFHPLWLWLLSAAGLVITLIGEQGIRLVVMLQSVLSISAALLYVRLLACAQVKTLYLILFYFAYLFICTLADIGQESALFGFLFALLISVIVPSLGDVSFKFRSTSRKFFIIVLTALIVLSRLDAFFILGGVVLTLWVIGQKKNAYMVAFGTVLGIIATLSFNYIYFGHIYSISSWLKSGFDVEKLHQIFIPGLFLRVVIVMGLLIAALLNYLSHVRSGAEHSRVTVRLAWIRFQTMPWPFVLTICSLLAYCAYFSVLFVEVSALGSWYFNQALGFSLFLYAFSTSRLSLAYPKNSIDPNTITVKQESPYRILKLIPLYGALVVGMSLWVMKFGWGQSSVSTEEMGKWLATNIPPNAVVFQRDGAGVVSYFASRHIINGDGLVNNMPYQRMLRTGRLCQYLKEQKVQYIVSNVLLSQSGMVEDYIYLWTKGVDAIPLIRVSPNKALFTSSSEPTYRVFALEDAVHVCS